MQQLNPSEISELIRSKIQNLSLSADVRTQGTVVTVTDGICRVHGLSDVMQGEILEFPNNTFGLALNLERDSVGAVILGEYEHITEGDTVKCTSRILEVPVGAELLGRVVNSLGQPIDGKGPIPAKMTDVIEKVAPGVVWRKSVSQPVQTGLKAIDSMVPIGRGQRELIIYDRLTKQAWAYRQISLLLRRPPGREAYPGDVFYLHSRLLERGARCSEAWVERFTKGAVKGKTGSLTALPIIETQAGDVTAFVPTNVISITDGQIFLETDLFNAGIRPAINAGISVSRVGGNAQTKVIKKLGGGVRLALAQYRELAAFAQFASDLDEATRKQLDRGRLVTELMKQPQYHPLQVNEMALTLFAVNRGYFDDVPVDKALAFEAALRQFMKSKYAAIMDKIESTKDLAGDDEKALAGAIEDFKKTGAY